MPLERGGGLSPQSPLSGSAPVNASAQQPYDMIEINNEDGWLSSSSNQV